MGIKKRFIINDIIEEKRERVSLDKYYNKSKALNKDIENLENIIKKLKK